MTIGHDLETRAQPKPSPSPGRHPGLERLREAIRSNPATPIGLLVVALWIAWSCLDGGFAADDWGPLGTALLLLLAVGVAAIPIEARRWSRARVGALAALGGFVAWNFLSLVWADAPGDAWVGADKALLYAACFAVFALWPWPAVPATLVLGTYGLGVAAIAVVWVVRVAAAADPGAFFDDGRLIGPTGYENATVALWMLALWPALYLGLTRTLPLVVRVVSLTAGTLFLAVSVLGQSRAWLIALPLAAGVFVLLARQRLRALLALAIAAVPAAAIVRPLVDVFESDAAGLGSSFDRAAWLILVACAVSAVLAATWAVLDGRVELSSRAHRRAGVAVTALAVVAIAASLAVALVRVDDPGAWIGDRWDDFTQAHEVEAQDRARLTGSLSGQRYEEWKVAWNEFTDHPFTGIGADNFQAAYLEQRADNFHEPLYPHSIPLRLLSQLGIVGTALFVALLAFATVLALRRRRSSDLVVGGAAAAALTTAVYWLVHGSADVLWEMPAIAAPAFGLLALAGARTGPETAVAPTAAPRRSRWPAAARATGFCAVVLAAAAAVALPWLSSSYQEAGARVWTTDAPLAYDRLQLAADLNPLAAEPYLVEGSIAVRLDDWERARAAFERALGRDPNEWYAYVQLAMIDAHLGDEAAARAQLARALALNPNDRVARLVGKRLDEGTPIDPNVLNRVYRDPSTRLPGLEFYKHGDEK